MIAKTFDINRVVVASAFEVDEELLHQFYKVTYPERLDLFRSSWRWINRTDFYHQQIPLILVYENQVIAHAGIMPVVFNFQGRSTTASWFIDFAVLPEFQRYGLGTLLTSKWVKFSDIQITFCNEKSIKVFKKNGWIESFNTYMHTNIVSIFNHPRCQKKIPSVIRKILHFISYPFVYLLYARYAYKDISNRVVKLDDKAFASFIQQCNASNDNHATSGPARDLAFCQWRILNSPFRKYYNIYRGENFCAIISIRQEAGGFIDVLCVSDVKNQLEIRNMICSLALLALKKNLSRIRFYTSDDQISKLLKRTTMSFVRNPRFAFYSADAAVHNTLKTTQWKLELIDSDFEFIL